MLHELKNEKNSHHSIQKEYTSQNLHPLSRVSSHHTFSAPRPLPRAKNTMSLAEASPREAASAIDALRRS
eukprot:9485822-Pyramimonas_sp.AAC.1